MNTVTPPRKGLTWFVTSISVANIDKSLETYTQVFGFTIHELIRDKKGTALFARITYRGCNLTMSPPGSLGNEPSMIPPSMSGTPSPISFYLYCDDLNSLYTKAKEHNLVILQEKSLQFWGDRTFRILDHDGYIWDIGHAETTFNPDLVPQELR